MTTQVLRTDIAVMVKAPIAGFAKTRLVGMLGAAGAARLHRRLVIQTVATAKAANLGRVTVWCAPDTTHRFFCALGSRLRVQRQPQPEGDLGERMLAAFKHQPDGVALLIIGGDCPSLTPAHLRTAAAALHAGADVTMLPAEDGGYVLIGLCRPFSELFHDISWGTDRVMAQTRERCQALGLRLHEGDRLWDVDRPEDLPRLARIDASIRR